MTKKGAWKEFLEATKPDILCLNEVRTGLEKVTSKQFYKAIPEGYE